VPGVDEAVHLPDGIERSRVCSIGVLFGREIGLEDGLQDQHRRRLAHPITQGGDAERAQFPVGLLDVDPSDRFRSILLLSECLRQFPEPALHPVRLDVGELLLVYPGCPLVGLAAAVGVLQDVRT
jgi:hypothetical protein